MQISMFKAVIRKLRYRELNFLIGEEIRLSDLESIESDLKKFFEANLASGLMSLGTSPKTMSGTMAKYGFLDLTFQVDPILLEDSYKSGLGLLKDLGFIIDETLKEISDGFQDELEDWKTIINDPICFEDLNLSLSDNKIYLRLFLKSEQIEGKGPHSIGVLPLDYLPRTFVVHDACVANSDFVWFHKYFYL